MAQQNFGAASPIAGYFKKIADFFDNTPKPASLSKEDTSWHDAMVRKANESFREADEKRRGMTLKGASSSGTRRRSRRKSAQPKPKYGK